MGTEKQNPALSKKDLSSQAGSELLSLCQTICDDGRLANQEVERLRVWLNNNWSSELPAAQFLKEVMRQVLVDGKITPEERRELQKAIESVLPADLRSVARQRRTVLERLEKARDRAESVEQAEEQRRRRLAKGLEEALEDAKTVAASEEDRSDMASRIRAKAVENYDFVVAGTAYEGRNKVIARYVHPGDPVYLARDRANRFSRDAIRVLAHNGQQIGFVPEEDAEQMASYLDGHYKYVAHVKKLFLGDHGPIPVIVADVFYPDTTAEGARSEGDVGSMGVSSNVKRAFRLGCFAAIALVLFLLYILNMTS